MAFKFLNQSKEFSLSIEKENNFYEMIVIFF